MFNIFFANGHVSLLKLAEMLSENTYFRCISMIFFKHLPYFLVQKCIFNDKSISQWEHHIAVITCDEGIECCSTRIELFYFDDNFRRIAQWILAFKRTSVFSGQNYWSHHLLKSQRISVPTVQWLQIIPF